MDRKTFLKTATWGGAGLLAGSSLLSACSVLMPKKLLILHTNDMHSHIEPFPANSAYPNKGGMAARASLIQKFRQEHENLLLLDAGDVFQGTPYFNFYGGEPELKLMSQMGYDACTIGNHEFDNGLAGLEAALEFANFPFLTANYDFSQTRLAGRFTPYRVYERGGIRVGVFGLGIELEGLVSKTMYEQTQYIDPAGTANEMVQELRAKHCDIIICLSHLGYNYGESPKISDVKLAESISGIDLILGGHTHTFMDEPHRVVNKDGHETVIHQVGWGGVNLGVIEIETGGTGPKGISGLARVVG